jgi:HSP20 family molecular chaperone IbpA
LFVNHSIQTEKSKSKSNLKLIHLISAKTQKMSPFTQLSSALSPFQSQSSHPGIDRNFSPIINYLDEFDRHFSHRHRFLNCFIPRFDLEEDASNYYLYGEVPGARVEDINIEATDEHTLVIHGVTQRPGPLGEGQRNGVVNEEGNSHENRKEGGNTYIDVDASNAGHPAPGTVHNPPENTTHYPTKDYSDPNPPAPRPDNVVNVDVSNAGHPAPSTNNNQTQTYPPPPTQGENEQQQQQQQTNPNQHRVLLSERIIGEFHRTFAFPTGIVEGDTKASVENGVLYLVVPKKATGHRKGRRIPVVGGLFGGKQ